MTLTTWHPGSSTDPEAHKHVEGEEVYGHEAPTLWHSHEGGGREHSHIKNRGGVQVDKHLFVSRQENTEKLYGLESVLHSTLIAAAKELGRLMGLEINDEWNCWDYWDKALPQELFSVLQHYSAESAEGAAKAYLESRGYNVSR